MNIKLFLIINFFVAAVIFGYSNLSSAQTDNQGLVPCNGLDCNFCYFLELIRNIIRYAFIFCIALAIIFILIGAVILATHGGSQERFNFAKSVLTGTIIGLIIIFASWILINSFFFMIVGGEKFVNLQTPWYQFDCNPAEYGGWPSSTLGSFSGGVGSPTISSGGGEFAGGGASGSWDENDARSQLSAAGIGVKQDCPNGVCTGCVDLNGIRQSTLNEILNIGKTVGASNVYVTGGTECGHSTSGTNSHANGYKFDLRMNDNLTNYVQNNYTYMGVRSDGALQYRAPDGAVYAKEGDHWDVLAL